MLKKYCVMNPTCHRKEKVYVKVTSDFDATGYLPYCHMSAHEPAMTITVRYFAEDTAHPEIQPVGNYVTLTGKVESIDPVFRTLQIEKAVVPFEDLVEVRGKGIVEIDQYLGIAEET